MKKLFSHILLSLFFFSCTKKNKETISSKPLKFTDNEIVNYVEYCNDRFHLCIDYPSTFRMLPESINGDGRSFINDTDSATITIYGVINLDNNGLNRYIDLTKNLVDIKGIDNIKNGVLIYGIDKNSGYIHKEKIITKQIKNKRDSANDFIDIIGTLQINYPKVKNKKYIKFWETIRKNFK